MPSGHAPRSSPRFLVLGLGKGKARVFLGAAAVREKRMLAREIDRTIEQALHGELADSELARLEQLADLADRLARGGM